MDPEEPHELSFIQPTKRLYEQVVEQIREGIIAGHFHDGDQLPTERELTTQLGVSRTVVREAMRALEREGLVKVEPGRGTFVRRDSSQAMKRSLSMMVRTGQAGEWEYLVELREILEPPIASLAAIRATGDYVSAMWTAVETMDKSMDDVDGYIAGDDAFHAALAQSSGNPLLIAFMESIVNLLHEQRLRSSLEPGALSKSQYHHRCIAEAIARHDADGAWAAMESHMQQIRDGIAATEDSDA
jgi:GntR family transcriptional repressor for pyruvate dehydrogenase complex